MGRVMRDDTMRKALSIRMNDKEMEMTKKYAEKHNLTITQTIVKAVKMMVEQEAKG